MNDEVSSNQNARSPILAESKKLRVLPKNMRNSETRAACGETPGGPTMSHATLEPSARFTGSLTTSPA